jgi:hypothetical protein
MNRSRSVGFVAALTLLAAVCSAQVSVTTYHNDISRTGQNTQESVLTPYDVNVNQFGKLYTTTVDGYVYAQPLYVPNVTVNGSVHNVLYVATEHDSVYAIDADTGQVLQSVSLLPAGGRTINPDTDIGKGCDDQVPEIGISGTPVIDTTTGTLYVVSKAIVNGAAIQQLHALDIGQLSEKFGGPVSITASVAGTGQNSKNSVVPFLPLYENQRPGLLLENGHVVIAFASHCDFDPWHGWVMSYNSSSLAQEAVFNATPNGSHGGIWMSGGGVAADGSGNLYFSTGNGLFNGVTDFGDSIVKLSPPSGGSFQVLDYFTPWNQASLVTGDTDVASGGVVLLPALPSGQQLLALVSKTGIIFELDRNNMGKYCPNLVPACTNSDTQIFGEKTGATTGTWGSPAYWNGNLYWGGVNDRLKVFPFNTTTGQITMPPATVSANVFQYPSPTASVSSNGNTNGIVWAIDNSAYASTCSAGVNCQVLYAYQANNLGVMLYNSNAAPGYRDVPGSAVKFATPMIANGKVFIGSQYAVSAFGELPGAGSYASTITGVSLAAVDNVTALQVPGTAVTGAGIDGHGGAYAANLIGTSIAWNGANFTIGAAGVADAVSAKTIALPPGNYATLSFLGTAVNNAQLNQSFVVTYSDGSSTTFVQSLSDWGVSKNFAGESVVLTSQYRVGSTGATQSGAYDVYGYTFALNSAKTAVSLTLPANKNVVVLAIDLGAATSGTTPTVSAPAFSPAAGTYPPGQTVTLSDATSGASIYYTTDGSTPSGSSTLYTGPISVSGTETISAIGVESGYTNSPVASASYTVSTTLSPPSFSPASGNYASAQFVILTDPTSGASIYYTTDGSTPTTNSTRYTGPINVSATTTINAIAAASGYTTSAVASAAYTITVAATPPTLSPVAGTYTSAQTVTLSDTTPGATIYYTTNGSTPTPTSTLYTGPITVSSTETISAIAVATGYTTSGVTSGLYTISSSSGATPISVSLATVDTLYGLATAGTPVTGGGLDGHNQAYAAALVGATVVWNGATFQLPGAGPNSAVTSATITLPAGNYATLSLLGSAVNGTQANQTLTVTYTDGTTQSFTQGFSDWFTPKNYAGESVAVATAYRIGSTGATSNGPYNLYGYSFALNSAKTVASLTLPANKNVVVLAVDLTPVTIAALPTFSPAPGTYTSAQTVTLSDATSGAAIYYTTNGSTPTSGSTRYAGPISVAATETVNAIAIATGYTSSAVATGSYTIGSPASTPTFSPAPGTYASAQSVTLSDTTAGASIYYTTDGSTPSGASTLYTGAITIAATETVNAIAIATGYTNSAVATGTYTINATASTPTFSPAQGTYTSTQAVTLSDTTAGASIYYTTDGSTPTSGSTLYTGPISVSASETINAIAVETGYNNSAVASAAYTIVPTASLPTFSPAPGTYTSAQSVSLTDATAGASIYYTTDGSTPTIGSTLYTGPISVSATETLNAIAIATGYANSGVATGSYAISAQGVNAVNVSLAAAGNLYGIGTTGTAVTGGGLDGHNQAYASGLLGSSLAWNGYSFSFAAAGPTSAVTSTTVALPAGNYSAISLLGSAVNGPQANQTFIVTYSDGTTASFTQSLSDWGQRKLNIGESLVLNTAYRIGSTGVNKTGSFNLYGYTFALNSAKTVASITLPSNANVVVLAIDLLPPVAPAVVSLAGVGNLYGLGTSGTAVTGGGLDGTGHAYAASLLGASQTSNGSTFTLAAAGAGSAVTSTTIALPAGNYVSLDLLGTAVNGNRTAQAFVVTYADGTTTTFTQSVSDWSTPQSYPGETTVLSMPSRLTASGTVQATTTYLYSYTFPLNVAKTVSSLTLPANVAVAVLGIDLTP